MFSDLRATALEIGCEELTHGWIVTLIYIAMQHRTP
jgi:hypothetical protein